MKILGLNNLENFAMDVVDNNGNSIGTGDGGTVQGGGSDDNDNEGYSTDPADYDDDLGPFGGPGEDVNNNDDNDPKPTPAPAPEPEPEYTSTRDPVTGNRIDTYEDGRTVENTYHGTISRDPDGNVTDTVSAQDGTHTHYNEDGTTLTTRPDGTTVAGDGHGNATITHPDKSVEYVPFPDDDPAFQDPVLDGEPAWAQYVNFADPDKMPFLSADEVAYNVDLDGNIIDEGEPVSYDDLSPEEQAIADESGFGVDEEGYLTEYPATTYHELSPEDQAAIEQSLDEQASTPEGLAQLEAAAANSPTGQIEIVGSTGETTAYPNQGYVVIGDSTSEAQYGVEGKPGEYVDASAQGTVFHETYHLAHPPKKPFHEMTDEEILEYEQEATDATADYMGEHYPGYQSQGDYTDSPNGGTPELDVLDGHIPIGLSNVVTDDNGNLILDDEGNPMLNAGSAGPGGSGSTHTHDQNDTTHSHGGGYGTGTPPPLIILEEDPSDDPSSQTEDYINDVTPRSNGLVAEFDAVKASPAVEIQPKQENIKGSFNSHSGLEGDSHSRSVELSANELANSEMINSVSELGVMTCFAGDKTMIQDLSKTGDVDIKVAAKNDHNTYDAPAYQPQELS